MKYRFLRDYVCFKKGDVVESTFETKDLAVIPSETGSVIVLKVVLEAV